MIFPFILFFVLLGWGLYEGDVYPKEGWIMLALWVVALLVVVVLKALWLWLVVPTVILDIILVLKVYGQDVPWGG